MYPVKKTIFEFKNKSQKKEQRAKHKKNEKTTTRKTRRKRNKNTKNKRQQKQKEMNLSLDKEIRQKQIDELSEYKLVLRLLILDPLKFPQLNYCQYYL